MPQYIAVPAFMLTAYFSVKLLIRLFHWVDDDFEFPVATLLVFYLIGAALSLLLFFVADVNQLVLQTVLIYIHLPFAFFGLKLWANRGVAAWKSRSSEQADRRRKAALSSVMTSFVSQLQTDIQLRSGESSFTTLTTLDCTPYDLLSSYDDLRRLFDMQGYRLTITLPDGMRRLNQSVFAVTLAKK